MENQETTRVRFICSTQIEETETLCILFGSNNLIPLQSQPNSSLVVDLDLSRGHLIHYTYHLIRNFGLESQEITHKEIENRKIMPCGITMQVHETELFKPKEVIPLQQIEIRCYVASATLDNSIPKEEFFLELADDQVVLQWEFPVQRPHFANCLVFNVNTIEEFTTRAAVRRRTNGEVVAQVRLTGAELGSETTGSLLRPILTSSGQAVGSIRLWYLVIHPLVHPNNGAASTEIQEEQLKHFSHKHVGIGHRGAGAQPRSKTCLRRAPIAENSLLSFLKAAELGADYVEFDVQMTRDDELVLNHDMSVRVPGPGPEIPIRALLAKDCLGYQSSSTIPAGPHANSHAKNHTAHPMLGSDEEPMPHARSTIDLPTFERDKTEGTATDAATRYAFAIRDEALTFAQLLQRAPPSLGFDVEVKHASDAWERIHRIRLPERNLLVDAVLKAVFDHAGDRPLFFSCFDPDICILLQRKQSKYPVFFLVDAGPFTPDYYDVNSDDPRCSDLFTSLRFASKEDFAGIIVDSQILLGNPEFVSFVKGEGLALFAYGSANIDPKVIRYQIDELGVDTVIADNLYSVSKRLLHTNTDAAECSDDASQQAAVQQERGIESS